MYEKLSERFNFKKKLKKKSFENVLTKSPNIEFDYAYKYKDWRKIEKKEFESIIEKNFQDYDKIKTII